MQIDPKVLAGEKLEDALDECVKVNGAEATVGFVIEYLISMNGSEDAQKASRKLLRYSKRKKEK
jgi:hypothetical protein